ncbi:MAG: branched-chain amino acid ABC transporter permease [Deltaproteobacteria bacterium]|nr:branched-chain amino acid ABC transporter permease [Deltaproteobacteria bacterium]
MLLTILDVGIAGILMGGIYSLVAAGFNLQYGVARILNVSHGEFIMLGAMGTFSLYKLFGINPLLSLVICSPVLFLLAIFFHVCVFQRLIRLSANPEAFEGSSLLACFGILFIIQNIALLIWGGDERGYSFMISPVNVLGAIFAANRVIALLVSLILGFSFYFFLTATRTGKAIRAVTQDFTAARLMGINTTLMQGLCFGLGALLAAAAGVLISTMFAVTPVMGLQYTVISMIVVVLGGLGNILGSMIGGMILGIIGSIAMYIHPGISLIAFYALFTIFILVKPEGIFSRR